MMKTIRKCGKQIALVMVAALVLMLMPCNKAYAATISNAYVYYVDESNHIDDTFTNGSISATLPEGASFGGGSITIHVGPFDEPGFLTVESGKVHIKVNFLVSASGDTSWPGALSASYSGSGYSGSLSCSKQSSDSTSASYEGSMEVASAGGSSSVETETEAEKQARLEEERKSSHFEVISTGGEKMESEVKGSFYYEQGAAVVKDDNVICKNADDYAVNTYVATESCQPAAYASVAGYATEGGYSVVSATSFNIIDVENNPYCESVSWFEANENNTITGNTKTFAFSDGRTITTDKYTKAVAGLPEKTEGKVIVVGVTKGGAVFTQEDQDDDPATVTFDALLGNGVYGFLVK